MIEDSDSDEEELMLLLALVQKKRTCGGDFKTRRKQLGEYYRLCRKLESNEDRFFMYFRMSRNSFEELHDLVSSVKTDTYKRQSIKSRERLAICLRYLSTGDSYNAIASSFRMSSTKVSIIIKEVCEVITNKLQPLCMPPPTEEKLRESESGYRELWGFPNCVGSIVGRHIIIKCTQKRGSKHCRKQSYDTIVLLAVIDPFNKFLIVDVGSYGRHDDMRIFENSCVFRDYFAAEKGMLPPNPLPGSSEPTPYVLIGDEGFILKPYLMRPFSKSMYLKDDRKRRFNERLFGARQTVAEVFKILTEKWGVCRKPIECKVETAIQVVKAICCLHNYVIGKDGIGKYIDLIPSVNIEDETKTGTFSKYSRKKLGPGIIPLRRNNQRSSNLALEVRENFVAYFDHG